jgi:predicted DNA binding CopG/RHH family protein
MFCPKILLKNMQKIIIETMSDLKLQSDEHELLASYENDEWQSAKNVKEQKEQYRVYTRATFRKGQHINIRISEKVLLDLQKLFRHVHFFQNQAQQESYHP